MRHFYVMTLAALAAIVAAFFFALNVHAQPVTTSIVNGTIAVTNTFQNVLANQNGGRLGCTIQNQGTHTMYIFPGDQSVATLAKSMQLSPLQTYRCGLPGGNGTINITMQDAISITGTAGDAFVANSQ